MKALTAAQVERYRHDGFLFPFPALSEAERASCLAGLERYERWLGTPVPQGDLKWRTQPHALLPWYADLVRHPRILDVVEDLIGPDILVWTGTFFIKEAGSPTFAAWHQDSTYFGLEPDEQVTAWVALTDASREAGCMEVLSRTARRGRCITQRSGSRTASTAPGRPSWSRSTRPGRR